jgi:hypothetical protein
MNEFIEAIEKNINLEDKFTIAILVTIAVILISTIVLFFKKSPAKKNLILILGASNSGKTTLYSQVY